MIWLEVVIWFIVPILNFLYWLDVGEEDFVKSHLEQCKFNDKSHNTVSEPQLPAGKEDVYDNSLVFTPPQFSSRKSKPYQAHKERRIVEFHNYGPQNEIVNYHPTSSCQTIVNHLVWNSDGQCLAIASSSSIQHANLLQRYNANPAGTKKEVSRMWKNPHGGPYRSSGFFTKGGNAKGRRRFREKIGPLIQNLEMVEGEILELLTSRGLQPGSDVTVLVTNDGQMDLFMNFACSCRHHSLSLDSVVVFAASREIVPLISATGAIGVFHEQFATASRKSSGAYLDAVFVDMMWYKAFSVWLILKLGYNVLFQDVDIIWFKNPFPYFHQFISDFKLNQPDKDPPDAFLSDDGQRTTVRYAPFYANSGFYYFVSNRKTLNLAWNIMGSFDVMQSSGSHQNVFTMKLMEALDFSSLHTQSLHLHNFSNGATFHHEKMYFNKIKNREVVPYMFHMCWTANKADKLKFLKQSLMWYVNPNYPVDDLIPGGALSKFINLRSNGMSNTDLWSIVSDKFCQAMTNAP